MKKLLSMILMLAVILLPVSALAASGDAILLRRGEDGYNSSVFSIAEVDGDLYALTYDGLYVFASGETKPVHYDFPLSSAVDDGDDDEDTAVSRSVSALIAYEGRPCVIVAGMETEYEGVGEERMSFSTVEGVWLCELTLEDGKAAVGEELTELDWSDLVLGGGDSEYLAQCDLPTVVGDTLYFASYDESYERVLVATDLTDGDTDVYYPADLGAEISLDSFCAYKDGQLLVLETEWGEDESAVKLYAIDVENEEATELLTLATGENASATGLAYRADTDTVYCIMDGEICAMTGMDASALQRVAEIPVSYIGSTAPIVTEDGFYIAADADYAALVRRNTDPAQRAQTRITVQDTVGSAITEAYYAFGETRGDVEVVMLQRTEDVVQAMMNRSTDVDVYCVNVDSAEFDAVYSRGYMAELTESEAISAFLENCYPFAREVCEKDGEIIAVPVTLFMDGRGYDPEAFARLGLTEEDVPKTWAEFFGSLGSLAAKIAEEPGMTLFEGFSDYETARMTFLSAMIADYMDYISLPENEFAFDTEAFRAALAAYEAVDWSNLGLPAPDVDDGLSGGVSVIEIEIGGRTEHNTLYSPYTNVSADGYTARAAFRPLLLSFAEGEQPHISATLYVAFVNPFSAHRDTAIDFLETVTEELDALTRIHLCPDENEPVRSPWYEDNLKGFDQSVANAEEQLAKAETEEERQAYEELVEEYKQYREDYLKYDAWTASEESIAIYREYAPSIRVKRNIGMGGENSEAFYELQQQYMDGMISADEFIRGVDGKLQMMMKEGM